MHFPQRFANRSEGPSAPTPTAAYPLLTAATYSTAVLTATVIAPLPRILPLTALQCLPLTLIEP